MYELVGKLPQGRIVAWQTLEMLVFSFLLFSGPPLSGWLIEQNTWRLARVECAVSCEAWGKHLMFPRLPFLLCRLRVVLPLTAQEQTQRTRPPSEYSACSTPSNTQSSTPSVSGQLLASSCTLTPHCHLEESWSINRDPSPQLLSMLQKWEKGLLVLRSQLDSQ